MTSRIEWPPIRELLEDAQQHAAIESYFPDTGRISFVDALQQWAPDRLTEIRAAGRRLEVAAQLADFPIIAIAGMLNSGKTSLVSTFLSDAGRQRSLRGESNDAGTHRFVLWLPQSWRADAEVWGLLMSRLGEALGQPPQMLSDDPAAAHEQYNNAEGQADALAIPLVATDPGLDKACVGLLDCPDIVTSEAFGRGALEVRKTLLCRAATLCSAFVMVTDFASLRANTVGELLDVAATSMSGVSRYLAINMIRPKYRPHEVFEDLQPLVSGHGITASYLAYDFEIPASETFVPEVADRGTEDDPMPVFFEASAIEPDLVKQIDASQLLSSLPTRLNRSALFDGFRRSQATSLAERVWSDGVDFLRDQTATQATYARRARQAICDASLEFFARRDFSSGAIIELRLHQSARIIHQLTDAFSQAAPWYARLGMKMNGFVSKLTRSASELMQSFNLTGAAQKKAEQIRDDFRKGAKGSVLSGERLCESYRRHDLTGQMRTEIPDSQLLEICNHAVERFDAEDQTALDPQQLRRTAEAMWQEMSMVKKLQHGLTPVAALFAAFAAVVMVPVDGGGTLVLMHASIAELLLATGFAGLVTAWNSHGALKAMELQAAQQQLADFIAVQCDSLGVPRGIDDQIEPLRIQIGPREHVLPAAKVALRRSDNTSIRIWKLRQPFLDSLHQKLPRD
ncbi:hypothetical protein [Rosistilla oblonga]|uniref:hypothetical protein n=1 Tax=Rosistilla oblonga TaxID=2527990 RepID=UPI003A9703F4